MKKLVFIVLVVAVLTSAAHADLFSNWKLDEGSGTIAHDSAGSNNGTLVNGPVWTTGKINGALDFDGVDDGVQVPHSDNLNITGDITIASWVYLKRGGNGSTASSQDIVSKTVGNGAKNNPFDFYINWYTCPMLVRADELGHEYVISTQRLSLMKWYHVAVTVENKDVNFYVDGNLTGKNGTLTKTPTGNSNPLYIGRRDFGVEGPIYFKGTIDDVRIYDRALSQSEIRAIMIPEPATLFLLGLGAVILRRKR